MKRREFLKGSKRLLVGSALGPLLPAVKLFANTIPASMDHFFVLIRTSGGMDVTLGLDPRTHDDGTTQEDVFIEYKPEDILQFDGGLKLGPAAKALAEFSSSIITINGIQMRTDAGHDSLRDYISSGVGDQTAPFLPLEFASLSGSTVLSNTSINSRGRDAQTTQLTEIENLINPNNQNQNTSNSPAGLKLLSQLGTHQAMGDEIKFNMEKFMAHRQYTGRIKGTLDEILKQGFTKDDFTLIGSAFSQGFAQYAIYNLNSDNSSLLDTHSSHEGTHLQNQSNVWNSIATLFKVFKSIPYGTGTLFDQTTFMVVSEFSRTPALNSSKGKDHNPSTNSVLLAGRNIAGGKTVGASRIIPRKSDAQSVHIGNALDYATGTIVTAANYKEYSKVNLIYPENVARTVAHIMGDPKGFSSVSLDIPVIPGVRI